MEVGKKIRQRRKLLHMSQIELSRLTGIAQSSISAIESSVNNPSSATLVLIAEALDCSLAELLGGAPDVGQITPDEARLLDMYRQLNSDGKDYIRQQFAIASHIYKQSGIVSSVEGIGG